MLQEPITILAINPGTKYLGIAVFQAQDLVYWGVKVLKGKWSEKKRRIAERAIQDLIGYYHVNMLIVKRLHLSRSSRNLDFLVALIKTIAKEKGLKLCLYSLDDIKKELAAERRINKMIIAEMMVVRYPFLVHEFEKEKKHKHPYFVRMFEAIAAGILAFNKLDHK